MLLVVGRVSPSEGRLFAPASARVVKEESASRFFEQRRMARKCIRSFSVKTLGAGAIAEGGWHVTLSGAGFEEVIETGCVFRLLTTPGYLGLLASGSDGFGAGRRALTERTSLYPKMLWGRGGVTDVVPSPSESVT